jgi:hypothetical protein
MNVEAGLRRDWVYGVGANALTKSHVELDASTELDAGKNPLNSDGNTANSATGSRSCPCSAALRNGSPAHAGHL